MAEFKYPVRDLDRPKILIEFLGTHWASVYQDPFVERYIGVRGQAAVQTELDATEGAASASRFKVPVFHTDIWLRITLKESDLLSGVLNITRYGEDGVYGGNPDTGVELKYGTPALVTDFTFPVPDDLREAPLIFNRITEPSVSMVDGLDFFLDSEFHVLHFRENPFVNDLIPKRLVYEGDVVVDREVELWIFRGQIDFEHIFNHYGFVLDIKLPSSRSYRDLVNSIWDGLVAGTSQLPISTAFAAMTGSPIIIEEEETVEVVQNDARHLLIVTDKNVYQFKSTATPRVSVGDVVQQGDELSNAFKIFEFHSGAAPEDLMAVTMGQGHLIAGFIDGITFDNKIVPLEVDTSGVFTRVEFEIGGFQQDTEKFWDDFHERGIAAGETLAQLLDQRTNKVGEPTAANLPATINPLEFLIANVLRNNYFVVQLRPQFFGEDAVGIENVRHLRRLMPPHTTFLITVELAVDEDVITMDGTEDETMPRIEEDLFSYLAGVLPEDLIDPDVFIEERPLLRYIEGICP